MTMDELQAAIDRAEAKRRELQRNQPWADQTPNVVAVLSQAAELYRRQIALGLNGDPAAALKARVFLREWFGGKLRLQPLPDEGLIAHWNHNVAALLRAVGSVVAGRKAWNEPAFQNIFKINTLCVVQPELSV